MEEIPTKRREKFAYLKKKGFPVNATMTNEKLDEVVRAASEGAEPPEKSKRQKRKRIPLGRHRAKMAADQYDTPGKVKRWVNDEGGRIDDALNGGYEFVQDPKAEGTVGEDPLQPQGIGSAVKMKVGVRDDGSPIMGYLMAIDDELYAEDQAEKNAELDEIDAAIAGGRHESDFDDGKYIPRGGIHYKP